MVVRVGSPAPAFVAEARVRGEPALRKMKLSELQGRWVILFFCAYLMERIESAIAANILVASRSS